MFHDNALALLGMNPGPMGPGHVAGLDFVGAAPMMRPSVLANPAFRLQTPVAAPVQYATGTDDAKMRALQQLAMAGYVPQIKLGVGNVITDAKIATTASSTFSPEGSVPLRITQFTVASSIAPFFVISNLTVARLNLLAGSVPIPAEDFIPNARHAPLEIPILAAGSQVVVTVTNIDANSHWFFASITAIDLTSASARMIP